MGLDLQRRGGIEAMHAVVKSVNRINSRCKKALEDLWIDIPGYNAGASCLRVLPLWHSWHS